MELFTKLGELFTKIGVKDSIVFVMLFVFLLQQVRFLPSVQKEIRELAKAVERLSRNVGRTVHTSEQTVLQVKILSENYVNKMLCYCKEIIEENDILNRKEIIKKNLDTKFVYFTQEFVSFLSIYNSPVGDVGVMFEDFLDWDVFIAKVFDVMFTTTDKETKMGDLQLVMNRTINQFMFQLTRKLRLNAL